MEIRTLRYFLAVAQTQNMTRAAQELHVTQPTLSKQIKALEQELGQKLFIRHSFSIELTEEGRLLRERAADLVALADKVEDEFASLRDIQGGDIRFGLAESWQVRLLAREIAHLRKSYPGLRYHIVSGDTAQVAERLDRGVIDFALLAEKADPDLYESLRFPEADAWGLIMPEGDALAAHDGIVLDDIVGLPLLCSGQGWCRDIPRWAGSRMGELVLDGEFSLSYNASLFVREGMGYILTFDHIVDAGAGSGLAFRPLVPRLETELYLVWRKGQLLSRMAQIFLAAMEESFGEDTQTQK
jgi:DNA-binding transcriptional LysR family regulator